MQAPEFARGLVFSLFSDFFNFLISHIFLHFGNHKPGTTKPPFSPGPIGPKGFL